MAWVSHQVVTNPLHLFDANIFYPERYTLAYSDHLFVQSMMGAPLLWAGAAGLGPVDRKPAVADLRAVR